MMNAARMATKRRLLAFPPVAPKALAAAVDGALNTARNSGKLSSFPRPSKRVPRQHYNEACTRAFHGSVSLRMAEVVMTVPSMGDSITEGTIRSWEKKVGEAVALDDVVVVIETDKVSVDIRASNSGVLVEQYAAVDDNVEVGAKLLKIDTQATASAPSSASAPSPPAPPTPGNPPPPSNEANPAPPPTDAPPAHRTPLIKFLGKRSLMRKQDSSAQAAAPPPPARSPSLPARHEDSRSTPGVKTFIELPPRFGHPPVTEEEMEAVESGGATL